jgi:hypothetical protein
MERLFQRRESRRSAVGALPDWEVGFNASIRAAGFASVGGNRIIRRDWRKQTCNDDGREPPNDYDQGENSR